MDWWRRHYDCTQDAVIAELHAIQQQNLNTDAAQQQRIERLTRENVELKVYVASLVNVLVEKKILSEEEVGTIVKRVDDISKRAAAPHRGEAKPIFRKPPAPPPPEDPNPATRPRRRSRPTE